MKSLKESFIKAKDLDKIKPNISYYVVLPFESQDIIESKKQYIDKQKDQSHYVWYILSYDNMKNTFFYNVIDNKVVIFKSFGKKIEDIKLDINRFNNGKENRIEYFKKLKYEYLEKNKYIK